MNAVTKPQKDGAGLRFKGKQSPLSYANQIVNATILLRYGARTNLINSLTGLSKSDIYKISKEEFGRTPKSGQSVFGDYFYRRNNKRLYRTTLIYHLFKRFADIGEHDKAEQLIRVYEAYNTILYGRPPPTEKEDPDLFTISRVHQVPLFVSMGTWTERKCRSAGCRLTYISPTLSSHDYCPSCDFYLRTHCCKCLTALPQNKAVANRYYCKECKP